MRHIHWPSTAHHGSLMVREFEREQTRRLAVAVDTVTDMAFAGDATPLDVCCAVAASVAFAARGAGQGVRFLAGVGGRSVSISRTDPAATLRWLAELRPGGGLAIADLVAGLGEELLGAATLMLAMPTWRANDPAALAEAIAETVPLVPRVVAVLVEVHTFPDAGRVPHLDPGRVDALEDAFRQGGALVFRLSAGSDLAAVLGRGRAGVPA
jgi:uncharacterized protein (DUF58 family)